MDDLTIKKNVVDQLMWDDRLQGSDIKVEFQNGILRLFGNVPNYYAKNVAEVNALQVNGVLAVKNELGVKSTSLDLPSDDELRERVKETLYWNNNIDYSKMDVQVNNHVVTLLGLVDSYWKVGLAEEIVQSIKGVTQVINKLSVVPGQNMKDEIIAQSIMEALERNPEIAEEKIVVKVQDGVVTIEGNVDNWRESKAAYQAALYTKGVKNIQNNLSVATEYSKY
jgi:osmotically-inducible protein OsmY